MPIKLDGTRKDAIHVRVSGDGYGFLLCNIMFSPNRMQRAINLSMEVLDLAICRHYLANVEGNLGEIAVENVIQKIVAEQT